MTAPTCASCREFPLPASVEKGGTATCTPRNVQQSFNDRACVLYVRARDIAERRPIVVALMRKE